MVKREILEIEEGLHGLLRKVVVLRILEEAYGVCVIV